MGTSVWSANDLMGERASDDQLAVWPEASSSLAVWLLHKGARFP
jgi:hypothetical protein